jgi:hypothetical protein
MEPSVHAAAPNLSARIRAANGLLGSVAACTFVWGWPEIALPAQAKFGLVFGLAMGAPTGVAIWFVYWLCEKILARAGQSGDEAPERQKELEVNVASGEGHTIELRVGGRAEKRLVL